MGSSIEHESLNRPRCNLEKGTVTNRIWKFQKYRSLSFENFFESFLSPWNSCSFEEISSRAVPDISLNFLTPILSMKTFLQSQLHTVCSWCAVFLLWPRNTVCWVAVQRLVYIIALLASYALGNTADRRAARRCPLSSTPPHTFLCIIKKLINPSFWYQRFC